eukprot:GHUV01056325.1.p1 GENE.GHUV01056325.1~~GHUV01056325.1.p1  ORF type:complete len:120 (+),score=4.95 GHUV01056325.1:464-823(+)
MQVWLRHSGLQDSSACYAQAVLFPTTAQTPEEPPELYVNLGAVSSVKSSNKSPSPRLDDWARNCSATHPTLYTQAIWLHTQLHKCAEDPSSCTVCGRTNHYTLAALLSLFRLGLMNSNP